MLESKITAAAIRSRSAYDKACKYLEIKEFTPDNALVMSLIGEYYERDELADRADPDVLLEKIERKFASNPKHLDLYMTCAKQLLDLDVSTANIIDLIVETKREEIGRLIATAILNKKDEAQIAGWMEQYQELCAEVLTDLGDDEEEFHDVSVKDVVDKTVNPDNLIKLLPKALNDAFDGGVLLGHHITVFARPETGKTALCCTLLTAFALQGMDVIYFGNEDPLIQIIQRTMSCLTGMDKQALATNPDKAQELLNKRGWKHIRFIQLTPGSPREIEKYVARYKPKATVLDQLRNIVVPGAGNKVEQLEEASKCNRRMGQKHKLVAIDITQAGDSASNKLVLDMGDVDSSNTGIPGQADALIGIGINAAYEEHGMRKFSLPKNKISGKHINFDVKINEPISRYENA